MTADTGFRVATAYVVLGIQEGDVQAQIEQAITSACQQAGNDGGTLLTKEIAAKVDGAAPDLSIPLIDSLAGAGDTAAAEIAGSLTERIAGAGDVSGTELAAALQAGTAEVGTEIAARVGGQLDAELPGEASAVAAEMAAELTAGTATVGDTIASRIGQQLHTGLEEAVQAGTAVLGQLNLAGASGGLAATAAGAGIMAALSATVVDAAAEAGGIAGVELSRNLSEAAVAALSDADFAAFTAMLVATASEAGGAAGVAAADGLGAGFASAGGGIDLIAAGMSTVGQSMTASAQAAAEATGEVLAAAEEATLTGIQAYEAELDAVFESIYQSGAGMTVQLAAAMTETFQGIEADTAGFSQAEMAIFDEFYATLQARGDQAALDLAERSRLLSGSALLGTDLMGSGLSSMGTPMPAATALEAQLGGVDKAAAGAAGSMGGMAGMMGGPWLWGVLGAVSILPMFSSMLGGNSAAAQQAAQMHQQLAQAVAQDSGAVGDNTAAVIQNGLAQSNLTALSGQLGLSQAQLIEYAAGEANVQTQVAAAYAAKADALGKTAGTTTEYGKATVQVNNASQVQLNQLGDAKSALDAVTASIQQTIDANARQTDALLAAESTTQIYTAAVADLVEKQKLQAEQAKMSASADAAYLAATGPGTQAYTDAVYGQIIALEKQARQAHVSAEATNAYLSMVVPGTQLYTNAVADQETALEKGALTARINAQALNDSLAPQARLSAAALDAAGHYQAASTATSEYTAALTGLYGQYGTTSGALAAFTTSVDNLSGQVTKGRDAVDLHTAAGAKNFAQFQQTATAAETYAEKLYQQTGDAKTATAALQDMAGKLDAAATKAGLTKDQVRQLNTELFGVPDIKTIKIQLDATQSRADMVTLDAFIQGEITNINNTPITPRVVVHSGRQALATGGPVTAGVPVITGDGGRPEVFVPNADGRIYPSLDAGARALAGQGSGIIVNQNFYGTQYPGIEQTADMYRQLTSAIGAAA
jgi:hypothetical protein